MQERTRDRRSILRDGRLKHEIARMPSTGRSVGEIVRSAIDLHFDEGRDQARRAAAARFLLATADSGEGPGETWEEMLAVQEAELDRRFEP